MGTPVAAALRRNFRHAKIIYLTHESLFPLLELSNCIDCFIPFEKRDSVFRLASLLKQEQPQLVIDLVGSLRTRVVSYLVGARTLTLQKWRHLKRGLHVVDGYLQTLADLQLPVSAPPFPSLFPSDILLRELADTENVFDERPLIALVPGVGQLRPNRAWHYEGWLELGRQLIAKHKAHLVLVGGRDDMAVCARLHHELGHGCSDVAGRLTLPLTAALLSKARLVVSADTGPAHIAVAVGTPVVCLTGPTDPLRTGPYGMASMGLHAGEYCHCRNAKRCRITHSGAGRCMQQIQTTDVLAHVEAALSGLPSSVSHAVSRPGNRERSLGS